MLWDAYGGDIIDRPEAKGVRMQLHHLREVMPQHVHGTIRARVLHRIGHHLTNAHLHKLFVSVIIIIIIIIIIILLLLLLLLLLRWGKERGGYG
jgi:hypothetical protein